MPATDAPSRKLRWLLIPLRVLLVSLLVALLSFAVCLLLGIVGLGITAWLRGVQPDMTVEQIVDRYHPTTTHGRLRIHNYGNDHPATRSGTPAQPPRLGGQRRSLTGTAAALGVGQRGDGRLVIIVCCGQSK